VTRDRGLLDDGSRTLRAVRAGDGGPWAGALVRTKDGASRVLVDASERDAAWAGWSVEPGGHVLAPLDVVRTSSGHAALLPVCAERLDDFVRRRAARAPLSGGEAVTLGVSILRGCEQLMGAPDASGEWWLDDAGRPVVAVDAAPRSAREAAGEALAAVAVDPRVERAWRAAQEAVAAERLTRRQLEEAEAELFRVTDAEPLVTVVLGPRRAVDEARAAGAVGPGPAPPSGDETPRGLWHRLAAHVDADLADTVSRATTAVWRRARTEPRTRRAPWLVAAAVACGVLAVGAFWPVPGEGSVGPAAGTHAAGLSGAHESAGEHEAVYDAAEHGETVGESSGSGDDAASSGDAPGGARAEDPVIAGTAVLDGRHACAGDAACLAAWIADPAAVVPAGAVDLPSSERSVTLIEDLGDVAVVRVDAADQSLPAQLVVLIRREDRWLLRDVHDVAHQP